MSRGRRIAVVLPRFGAPRLSRAESTLQQMASGLAARDWDVEALTTCATSPRTWSNARPEGAHIEDGISVLRFATVKPSPIATRSHAEIQKGETPSTALQAAALQVPFRAPGLFRHLLYQSSQYELFLFAPYRYWTTTGCLPLVADRAVLLPGLRDEPLARLEVIRPILRLPAACWFLSERERRLARRLGEVSKRQVVWTRPLALDRVASELDVLAEAASAGLAAPS